MCLLKITLTKRPFSVKRYEEGIVLQYSYRNTGPYYLPILNCALQLSNERKEGEKRAQIFLFLPEN